MLAIACDCRAHRSRPNAGRPSSPACPRAPEPFTDPLDRHYDGDAAIHTTPEPAATVVKKLSA